ncbi:hypothetical protein CLOSTMETH_03420 [[Clostridium] methylpentosum DSM 5476]|uniref:Uncharacterized protein n=1 Tax=[Clostridium] methylpentosum DSM 5476 TaxID=537013 RepID=C0EHS5_9FIRM|nr:hypothetical protein CLOSTMETH_03420 [[Clostridium] methylpentosum DSM 5476]
MLHQGSDLFAVVSTQNNSLGEAALGGLQARSRLGQPQRLVSLRFTEMVRTCKWIKRAPG